MHVTETGISQLSLLHLVSYRIIKGLYSNRSVVLNMQVKDFMDKQSVFNLFR